VQDIYNRKAELEYWISRVKDNGEFSDKKDSLPL